MRKRPLLLDGATGTELIKRGLPAGAAPEHWIMSNPLVIQQLQREYYEAGSDIVMACTFGANRMKLSDHGLADEAREMNLRLVAISREIVPSGKLLFGDISPTGQLVEPFGPLLFEEAVAIYREQAEALCDGGVDGFIIETMLDIQEARAALLGAREAAPDLPVIISMTYEKSGKTISGTPPEAAIITLQALGADAVGCNCSTGPDEMLVLMERMLPYAKVPVFIKPNAGMPCHIDGHDHYDLGPEPFAEAVVRGIRMGARIVGGCCGTTPDHIRVTRGLLARNPDVAYQPSPPRLALSSARKIVDLSPIEGRAAPLQIIGERINPTGKKAFQAELLAGDFSRITVFAEEQTAAGANLLDVNLGLGGIDEPSAIRTAVGMLAPATETPLVMDSVNPAAMEAALRFYPGRALVNSVSGEQSRLESILPLAAKYGAAIIVLPVGDGDLPATAAERMRLVAEIVAISEKAGICREDMLVDGLAMTVSADPAAGVAALETIAACTKEGLGTVLGLSNVSFGMPERKWLNAVFLAMGMANGLTAVIANPSSDLLMEVKTAADALSNRHEGTAAYIGLFAQAAKATKEPVNRPGSGKEVSPGAQAAKSVLKGNIKKAASLARSAVTSGLTAGALVSEHLVPAIMKAGELFEKQEYYLPQLMLAGEAMRLALGEIEPDLAQERRASGSIGEAKGRIIMATVKGDVHDIGKNLVSLMLRNHGYEVFDVGKDVSAEEIIAAAKENRADIVGLSALMTTTLEAMKKTILAVREAGVTARVMVGGAAVTEHFAAEIGADGYAPDAVTAVKLAGDLMVGRALCPAGIGNG